MAETNSALVLGIVNMVLLLVVLGVVAAIGAKLHLAGSSGMTAMKSPFPVPPAEAEAEADGLLPSGAEHLDKNLIVRSRVVPSRKEKKEYAIRATTGSRSLSGAGPAGRKMRK